MTAESETSRRADTALAETKAGPPVSVGRDAPGPDSVADTEGRALMHRIENRLFDRSHEPVRVGRFTLLRSIGSGGMGVVHLAYDDVLDRKVAVKLIHAERARSPEATERLLREARAMARVSHANVVSIFEAGEYADGVFIAMEFVQGCTLGEWLAQHERPWTERLAVLRAAGQGLAAAHAASVVHRDFKPDNVLLTSDGIAKVTDFGLAGIGQLLSVPDNVEATGEARVGTRTRTAMGTPSYMPPEQFEARPADDRSDQFSFCVVLYEALFGARPFAGETLSELSTNVIEGNRRPIPGRTAVPRRVGAAIARGLSVDPDDRWPSMAALLQEITIDPRRRSWTLAVAGTAVAGVVVAVAGGEDAPSVCAGAEQRLAGIWDDERRADIEAAVTALGTDYAARTWARIEPRLSEYAQSWQQGHRSACEATRLTKEQSEAMLDRRVACLDRARLELSAAVTVLAAGQSESIANADVLVSQLPPLSRCADAAVLLAEVDPPSPSEVQGVAAVHALLAESRAEARVGHYDTSLVAAEAAETHARSLSYGPVQSEVALALGQAHALRYDGPLAVEAFRAAQRSALSQGQWALALDATRNLGFNLAARRSLYEQANEVFEVARGLLPHAQSVASRAGYHSDRAAALAASGRIVDAIDAYRVALDEWEHAGPGHELTAANVRTSLGEALLRSRDLDAAERELQAADAEIVAEVGDGHPLQARVSYTRARVAQQRGDSDVAATLYASALALARARQPRHPLTATYAIGAATLGIQRGKLTETTAKLRDIVDTWLPRLGPDYGSMVLARCSLGGVLLNLGKAVEAELEFRLCLQAQQRRYGDEHTLVATTLSNLGSALVVQRRFEEAEPLYRRSVRILAVTLGPDSPRVARARVELAGNLIDQARYEEAERELRPALAVMVAASGPDDPQVGMARNYLGNLLLSLKRYDAALEQLRASLRSLKKAHGEHNASVARTLFSIAAVEMLQDDTDAAVSSMERAVAIYRVIETSDTQRGEALHRLAVALWLQGRERKRALALGHEALEILQRVPDSTSAKTLAELRSWLADPKSLRVVSG